MGPPWDSAKEEEDEEVSKEQEWRQKLQGELEDEWQEVIGRFEDDASHDVQEPEYFSAWSDRLARSIPETAAGGREILQTPKG
ncbi:NF-kappa-B inhibitor-like protein 1 [Lemmus lemmus]